MSTSEQFRLRWRSKVTGPFPLAKIEQMLDEHEVGLYHEIEMEDRWMTLDEFFAQRRQRERQAEVVRQQEAEAERAKLQPSPVPHLPLPQAPLAGAPGLPPNFPAVPPRSVRSRRPLYRPKSLKVFVGLGLVLGFGGAHNFYAGYRGTALLQLVLTAVTLWLGFGLIVSWTWALIELLIVQTDRKGVRMV